jgi:LysM repeat protein
LIIPSGGGSNSGGGGASNGTISDRSGQYHVVKKGESLPQIASQYSGVSVDDIVRANGIVNGLIYAGAALYLSGPGHVASGSAGELAYTVRSGDRLGDIAHQHGVSISSISSINKISNPNLIRAGQTLVIPSGTQWVCPVGKASFINDWGFPRGGGVRYHEGNDLFVSRGTPVRAPVSGTVRFITGSIGGLQFSLDADDGVRYIGTHMDKFGKDGRVRAGEIIGYVGNTGNAAGTRPHLHFGMYYKGTPVNPYPTLIAHGCK